MTYDDSRIDRMFCNVVIAEACIPAFDYILLSYFSRECMSEIDIEFSTLAGRKKRLGRYKR